MKSINYKPTSLAGPSSKKSLMRKRQKNNAQEPSYYLQYLSSTVGGLLASSCCVIQLALNVFSFGCAGFSVLDDYRPLFLVLTFTSLFASQIYLRGSLRSLLERRFIISFSIACGLALPPTILQAVNAQPTAGVPQGEVVIVEIDGAKCEACRNRARDALASLDGVVVSSVTAKTDTVAIAEAVVPNSLSNSQIEEALRKARFEPFVLKRYPATENNKDTEL